MTTEEPRAVRYWNRYTDGEGAWHAPDRTPPGEELAALRAGAGRDPGTVPSMWPFATADVDDVYSDPNRDRWDPPFRAVAEHHALVLYAIHQQSQPRPVHRKGIGVGKAIRRLHEDDSFSEDAVDRRFYAAVTADEISELTHHLRGLIRQLRSLKAPASLDYGLLEDDLVKWHNPNQRDRVRRRWGRDYHARPTPMGVKTLADA